MYLVLSLLVEYGVSEFSRSRYKEKEYSRLKSNCCTLQICSGVYVHVLDTIPARVLWIILSMDCKRLVKNQQVDFSFPCEYEKSNK